MCWSTDPGFNPKRTWYLNISFNALHFGADGSCFAHHKTPETTYFAHFYVTILQIASLNNLIGFLIAYRAVWTRYGRFWGEFDPLHKYLKAPAILVSYFISSHWITRHHYGRPVLLRRCWYPCMIDVWFGGFNRPQMLYIFPNSESAQAWIAKSREAIPQSGL